MLYSRIRSFAVSLLIVVMLLLSSGCPPEPATTVVPNVQGQTQTTAWTLLNDAGLAMGAVDVAYSDTILRGLIISQTPSAGVQHAQGAAVNIVISMGVEPVTVPDVTGMLQAAAETDMANAGFTTSTSDAYSDTVQAGRVIAQDPLAGEQVPNGSEIELVISLGPASATVPYVLGMTQVNAETAIGNAGLTASDTQEYHDTVPEGLVIAQDPAPGEDAAPGSTVAIRVSLGREPVTLPDVVGMLQAAAESALTAAGFLPEVSQHYSDTVAAGRVISQDPPGGSVLAPGISVAVEVSAGPEYPAALITEFVSVNDTGLQDEDGDYPDWIEIYNPNVLPINLSGFALTDDNAIPQKWLFPDIVLEAHDYLVVFASGKDRLGAELHTNFKLSSSGEYLALFNADSTPVALSEFAATFPRQFTDYAYALHSDDAFWYFSVPTPGAANQVLGAIYSGYVEAPVINQPRGFHATALSLSIFTVTPGATIRYTLDGTAVTETNGTVYSIPLDVTDNTVIRARAFAPGLIPSVQQTSSFFIQVPLAQQARPTISIVADPQESLYEPNGIMAIVGGIYNPGGNFYVDDVIFQTDPTWAPVDPGDYNNPMQRGRAYERPTSLELIYPADNSGFQLECGLRVQGSNFHRPRYRRDPGADWTLPGQYALGVYLASYNKFSFRAIFRDDYGAPRLEYPLFPTGAVERFDELIFRGGHNDGYNPFIHDELIRRLGIDTGQIQSRGFIANLFINGEYKGYYNIVERLSEEFFRDWYASDLDWDIITQSEVREGDAIAFDELINFARTYDLSLPLNYAAIGERLDLVNFVDYLLVQLYVGNEDWPSNNWVAASERSPEGRFRFYIWDSEASFREGNINKTGINHFPFGPQIPRQGLQGENCEIAYLYRALILSAEFRALFSERAHLHFAPGGALSEENVQARYDELKADMLPMRPDFQTIINDIWIPNREAVMIDVLRGEGLYVD